jgi:hypothetical protein
MYDEKLAGSRLRLSVIQCALEEPRSEQSRRQLESFARVMKAIIRLRLKARHEPTER